MPGFLPWLKRLFRERLGIKASRFAGCATGTVFVVFLREAEQVAAMSASPMETSTHCVDILPHNAGDNAFTFSFHHIISLSLENMSLELWDRRGVSSSIAGFASLLGLSHACLHGNDFSCILVLAKVEALQHIPHHLAFHRIDGAGIYANVIINEVWDVACTLGSPSSPPLLNTNFPPKSCDHAPPCGLRRGHANPRALRATKETIADRAFRAYQFPQFATFGDAIAMVKLSTKPKLRKYDTFTIPTIQEIAHEDEDRLSLKPILLATEVRRPHAEVAFDADTPSFMFSVKMSNIRSALGIVMVGPANNDHNHFLCFDLTVGQIEHHTYRSILFKLWPKTLSGEFCFRTLPLLPSIECKHLPKTSVPSSMIPDVGPLLSLAGEPSYPTLNQPLAQIRVQAHQVLNSRPIYT